MTTSTENLKNNNEPECVGKCEEYCVSCPTENNGCRYWMNYEDDLNCMFVAIKNNKGVGMTLREIAEREGVSHVQVFHDEKRALQKVRDSRGIEDVL